ncbi:cysteine peptidase family C39 domain-containing protein [Singulisphaera sp. GP187]|uniref:cysteine peptidase family C39 domain-containing protein n=1 Tax=Singulisphaera sp. GP187 TaxID=1882752 RepID=UPI0020B13A01|nr:cysteine peptidase family C39 domain-containing protein [Singulisphaera sp. GP187]
MRFPVILAASEPRRLRGRRAALGPRAGVILLLLGVLPSPPHGPAGLAFASIPSPREEGDFKSGKITPLDSLPPEKRAVRLPKGREFPDYLKFGTSWQEPILCGPNALFVLLRLRGLDVTRDQVTRLVPITKTGSSLADLSKAASALGLRHEVRKVSQSELFRLSPPFLVHEDIRSTDPEVSDSGHFFVVVRFNDHGQVGIIDGVSGNYQFVEKARFDRSFSGYVLMPEMNFFGVPTQWAWGMIYVLAAVVAIQSCVLAYLKRPVAARPEAAAPC